MRVAGRIIFVSAMLSSTGAQTGPQLPVPCVATSCGNGTTGFVAAGMATAAQKGGTLAINQSSNSAALNWASFNIGAGGKVVFTQPSATAVALNRIYDANPSSIFGSLSANGQIYLINANGFLFGAGSTVNVAGLIASSLNMLPSTFSNGILAPALQDLPALQAFTDTSGNPVTNTGIITVQPGAQLTAAGGGRLLLAAPTVSNGGTLTAPDGQVVLAAGQSVYLTAGATSDPNLRGLIVQVDGGGKAANQLTGLLSAPRGNITMVGLAVNQDGRISATTSVSANGSVTLVGGDGYVNNQATLPSNGGSVELGAGSSIDIEPEYADTTTAVAAQTQLSSTIDISAQQVFMHGGVIDAPGGNLSVLAAADPNTGVQGANAQAKIRIDAGTSIDLAGSVAQLPVSANLVTVQLRSNELADDPTQRNGALRGDTVTVDARADNGAGTPIADLTSAIAAVGSNIAQRTENGGTVSFQSEGDIVFNPTASINVSGGATNYQGGIIQTTTLIGSNGQLYDIGNANPLLTYKGVINPTFTQSFNQWGVTQVVPTPGLSHYQSGYVQGANAGSITFAAPSLVLDGTLQASVQSGPYQRGPIGTAFGDAPSGGTLIIGYAARLAAGGAETTPVTYDFLSPSVTVTAAQTPIVVADDAVLPPETLQLPASYLTQSGLSNVQIYSNTSFSLPAGLSLQLTPGAALTVEAPRIDVDSSIAAPSGTLNFVNVLTTAVPTTGGVRGGIGIGDGVTLDVTGQWTNDALLSTGVGTAPTMQNAGSINLQLTNYATELTLGNGVSLKADGGAWVGANGALTYGTGGSLTLDASPYQAALQFGSALDLEAFGTGSAAGGSLSLLAPRIAISQGEGSAWTSAQRVDDLTGSGQILQLYAPLFSDYGFSSLNLAATGLPPAAIAGAIAAGKDSANDSLTVLAGTTIMAVTESRELQAGYQNVATGGNVAPFLKTETLPGYLRPATSVALAADRPFDEKSLGTGSFGILDIQVGASILADPGASIGLKSEGSLVVAGALRAPGGQISLHIVDPLNVPGFDENNVSQVDPGYLARQGIDLAPTAVLDVSGTSVLTPNSVGFLSGSVLSGGNVTLQADRGFVTAETGSLIDISGTAAALDVSGSAQSGRNSLATVASAGGSLSVSSFEAISLLGALKAAAGVGSTGQAAAGSLTVALSGATFVPDESRQIELVDNTNGATPSAPNSGLAVLGVQELRQSGIDSLTLQASAANTPGNILLDALTPLVLGRQIVLDSPSVTVANGIAASLSAPFVQISNSGTSGPSILPPAPVAGSGMLTVSAQQINLLGNVVIQGVSSALLTAQGDVQLEGTNTSNYGTGSSTSNNNLTVANPTGPMDGSLTSSGNLTIDADRVYPATYTQFALQAPAGAGTTVTIGQTAASPGSPLSADSLVAVTADNIAILGTLLAPFGSISLTANDSLTLGSGSLVSVSGAGLAVPFGQTQYNAAQWIYTTPNGNVNQITAVPGKQVTLTAPSIALQSASNGQAAATVNLQGGGDLYAYEFVPGTGGTQDALTVKVNPNLYAILPAAAGQSAPYDAEESASASQTKTVYLSGGAGIAAGYYALLPARYALEPGAVLVQVEPTMVSTTGGQIGALADGTPVIAGYLGYGSTGLHAGTTTYEGFALYPGSYGQQLASYTISNASSFFGSLATAAGTGAVSEPADAGTLSLVVSSALTPSVTNSLSLQGSVLTAAASGGRGALVNISAPDLTLTAANSPVASSATTGVTVAASILQGWDAGLITLGGTTTDTTVVNATTGLPVPSATIAVAANNVTIGTGVSLSADQIDVVAQHSIEVQSGATLASTSGAAGTVLKTLPQQQIVTLTDTSGNALPQAGLLAVSDLNLPIIGQSVNGILTAGRSPLAAGATGASISLDAGSSLKSGGAVALDAPGAIGVTGAISGKGASWSLSSSSISFLGSADTLNIDSALLATLQQAAAVRLASTGSIDIDAPVTLGATAVTDVPTLSALTLIGTSLNNATGASAGGSSGAVFGAGTLTLGGAAASSNDPFAAGSGTLSLVADTLIVGPGTLAINGFAQTQAQVSGALETQGAGSLNVGGALKINAVELTAAPYVAAPGTDDSLGTTLLATGPLSIGAPTTLASGNTLPTLLGGNLTLSASSIDDAGAIVVPSGLVALTAGSGDLHLASTATIDAAGTMVGIMNQNVASPGGSVALTASGNVTADAGSSINVAGAGAAPAGSLSITGGVVDVSGTLAGAAGNGAGSTGGSFALLAGSTVNGLTALASALATGGFTQTVDIRVNNGDLDLASGTTLTANAITLTADTGRVDVAGVLSAPSGATRGFIELNGGTGVMLEGTAQLHADGAGSAGRGGEIDINSTCGTCNITLASGSVISTAGAAQSGELVLRAPVVGGNDVAINVGTTGIGADVGQAGQVIIEPVITYAETAATINNDLPGDVTAAATYLSNAIPVISARLATPSTTPVSVQAGVELQDSNAADAVTLQGIDLSATSLLGQVVNLNVRSAGNLTVNGTLSDGVIPGATSGKSVLFSCAAGPCASGSISLVGGADVTSANPLGTLAGSAADLTLGSSGSGATTIVRTGTGDLNLVAARDVVFNSGASAYIAGVAATPAVGIVIRPGHVTPQLANFGTDGGNVRIAAGADIQGAPVSGDNGDYSVTGWQMRQGNATIATLYGTNLDAFDWNTGALGGGDVVVKAGGQVNNLSAAVADSYGPNGLIGAGGGLRLAAGGDIGSAQIYVADGTGTLTAGGGLTAILPNNAGQLFGSSFALGNSSVSVWTRQGIQLDALYNPTYAPQGGALASSTSSYLTYGANSALSLASTDGSVDLELSLTPQTMGVLLGPTLLSSGSNNFLIAPASLALESQQQDINLNIANDGALLFPSASGQLTLIAGRDIVSTGGALTMADDFAQTVPTAAAPGATLPTTGSLVYNFSQFQGLLHVGDTSPAIVAAGRDIDDLGLSIPKSGQVLAGRDINNLVYAGQNLASSDNTLISAGRDMIDGNSGGIRVGGPGSVDVFSGRNLDLGFGDGILTVGNLSNVNLPSAAGADLTVLVGYGSQGADYTDFLKTIVEPSAVYQTQLVDYVESLSASTGLTAPKADSDFTGLSYTQQTAFIDEVFSNELLLSGRAANAGTGVGFTQGYNAIAALFPNSRTAVATGPDPYAGNLTLTSTQIYTLSGGSISILVPGGDIDVGLATPPANLGQKPASSLGIVAQGAGNVDIYAKGDVNVNKSRIFTLGGGNILIWSDEGSIDAGNGSKSSLSVPPPVISVDASGNIVESFGAALAAGSGIRTIQTDPNSPPGDVDLDAPIGTVNAGDAGIGAAGNINIAAAHVIGVSNINFGGTSSGVPSEVSNLGATLSGATSAASGSTTSATGSVNEANAAQKDVAPLAQNALSWLDVFVTGLGEENCKPDDRECLARQKTATP